MSYSYRNSLILGILLCLAIPLGAYWVWGYQAGKMEALRSRKQALRTELDGLNAALGAYDSTRALAERLEARWQRRSQVIPDSDNPAETLAYLQAIQDALDVSLDYDFRYLGRAEGDGYGTNSYKLEGSAQFKDVYAFLQRLEQGRRFCAVDRLEIQYHEPESRTPWWERVSFSMTLRAFFKQPVPDGTTSSTRVSIASDGQVPNPFRPLITRTLPPNGRGLFQVEGARLKGLTRSLAYVEDSRGQTYLLREGDEVYLGILSKIDIHRSRVEFVLNRGGIGEHVVMKLGADSPKP